MNVEHKVFIFMMIFMKILQNGAQIASSVIFAEEELISSNCSSTFGPRERLMNTYQNLLMIQNGCYEGIVIPSPTTRNDFTIVATLDNQFPEGARFFDKRGFIITLIVATQSGISITIQNQSMSGTVNWRHETVSGNLVSNVFMDFDERNEARLIGMENLSRYFFMHLDTNGRLVQYLSLNDVVAPPAILQYAALSPNGDWILLITDKSQSQTSLSYLHLNETYSNQLIGSIYPTKYRIWIISSAAFYISEYVNLLEAVVLYQYDITQMYWNRTVLKILPAFCHQVEILTPKRLSKYSLVSCFPEGVKSTIWILGFASRSESSNDTSWGIPVIVWSTKMVFSNIFTLSYVEATNQVVVYAKFVKNTIFDNFNFKEKTNSWFIINLVALSTVMTQNSISIDSETTQLPDPRPGSSLTEPLLNIQLFGIILAVIFSLILLAISYLVKLRNRNKRMKLEAQDLASVKSTISTASTLYGTKSPLSIPGYLELKNTDYRILKQFQAGGSCTIHLVELLKREPSSSQYIAKVPHVEKNGLSLRRKEQFLMEVALHHYLNTVSERFTALVGYEPNSMTMIMKYYKHGSLNEWVLQSESFSKKIFLSLLHDIASGLQMMHSLGFAHCDIKPENVLIDCHKSSQRLTALITDLGISRVVENLLPGIKHFHIKSVHGLSIMYAAPESILEFRDRASYNRITKDILAGDIYSFGILLYQSINKLKHPWRKCV